MSVRVNRPLAGSASALALSLALTVYPSAASAADLMDNLRAAVTFGQHDEGGDIGTPATAKPGVLLVDCIVNGVRLSDLVEVEVSPDHTLILPIDAWRAAGLVDPATTVTTASGLRGVRLDALDGVTYRLDISRLMLTITAAPARFTGQRLVSRDRHDPGRPHTGTGVYLDYDMSVTAADDGAVTYGGATRAVVFSPKGSIVAGAILAGANRGPAPRFKLIRTETFWQLDMPDQRQTLVVGDAVSGQSAWSRQVRFGGIRWARNFAVVPNLVTFPLPTLEGSAALPSTADILLDGNTVRQGLAVAPGPFAITNLPAISGDGRINLVVRDPAGVQTIISRDFYVSPRLLTPGLSDFSFEAGALRRDYGLTSDGYGPLFVAGAWRQGATPSLTLGGRLELQRRRQAAGAEFDATLGSLAAIHGAAAWSRHDGDPLRPSGQGGHYLLGVERSTSSYTLFAQGEWFDSGFTQFGDLGRERIPRDRIQAGASARIGPDVNLGLRYLAQSWRDGSRNRLLAANVGVRLPDGWRINAYAADTLMAGQGWSVGLSLTRSFGGLLSARTGIDRSEGDDTSVFVSASKAPPTGDGVGWHAEATTQDGGNIRGGIVANTRLGQFNADVTATQEGGAVRLGARGAIGWLAGMPFATREIGDRAFAIVRLDDLADISVLRSNQPVARTNARGSALVTGLLPYEANQLSVATAELPLDVEITSANITAVPFARSGIVVHLPVRRSRHALVRLALADGTLVPLGAHVTLNEGRAFLVGRGGAVWLEGMAVANNLAVTWQGGTCTAHIPDTPAPSGLVPCR
jgi:outer membrane usher protein